MGENGQDQRLGWLLSQADAQELVVLLREHAAALDARAVQEALRNPYSGLEAIEVVLASPRLLTSYQVRRALVRHPQTPQVHATRLVPGLFWRDLLEVSLDLRLMPALRRLAERYLVDRLPSLTLGERISLARRAGTTLLQQLRFDAHERVIAAFLENPRLTEGILLPMLHRESTPPPVLRQVAASRRWGVRYEVRLALSRNPRLPLPLALGLLPGLKKADLQALARDPRLAPPLRRRADVLLGRVSAEL